MRFFALRLGSTAAAEDLVQDIYVKLAAMEPDAEVQNDAAYLYRLGTNLMLDRMRQQRRQSVRDGSWREINVMVVAGEEIADGPGADEAVASRQRLARLLAAMRELPPMQRQAFALHKLEGQSQADTAAALGVSVSSVEKYVRAALRTLAEKLG